MADWSWPEGMLTEAEVRALAEAWRTEVTSLAVRTDTPALTSPKRPPLASDVPDSPAEPHTSNGPADRDDLDDLALSDDELAELADGLDD